jgi:acetyl esterase
MRDGGSLPERVRLAAQAWTLRALARSGPRVLRALAGGRPHVVDGLALDPMLQLVRAVRMRQRVPGLAAPDPVTARARFGREMRSLVRRPYPVGAVRDVEIPTAWGAMRARHYAPDERSGAGPGGALASRGSLPLLVWLHGGGWVIGDLDTHDEACRILCAVAREHILAVDYRLAPEHPHPAALDDARAALRWAQASAVSLGACPMRVSIGGDSAGGNLAAVVARLASREGTPPRAQLLVYPATDLSRPYPSHERFATTYFLDDRDRREFRHHYIDGTGVDPRDPRVSPLLAPDLHGLPPALVVTAGFDVLRDEGIAYADALRAAGSGVVLARADALGHGFVHLVDVVPAARAAMTRLASAWRDVRDGRTPASIGADGAVGL